jgi:hypothetical protein
VGRKHISAEITRRRRLNQQQQRTKFVCGKAETAELLGGREELDLSSANCFNVFPR